MPRFARAVVPGVPHHVTQRGVRRMQVFFSHADYRRYLQLLALMARRYRLETWAYCLMPNHVHLIAVPGSTDGLARPIGEAHRRYAVHVNRREGWAGHLWQERFASCPMDEAHLMAAVRYVLLNPVRSGFVARPEDWPHSSARAHLRGERDPVVETSAMDRRVECWADYLKDDLPADDLGLIRRHTSTGRPLGSDDFIEQLEQSLIRRLRARKPGPAPSAS